MGASNGKDSSNQNDHIIKEELRKDGFESDSGNKKNMKLSKN